METAFITHTVAARRFAEYALSHAQTDPIGADYLIAAWYAGYQFRSTEINREDEAESRQSGFNRQIHRAYLEGFEDGKKEPAREKERKRYRARMEKLKLEKGSKTT